MFDVAPEVLAWHAAGEVGVLARVVSVAGLSSRWPAQAVALCEGGRHTGQLLASVADPQLLPVLTQALRAGDDVRTSVVDVLVPDDQARAAGLVCGGSARVLVQPTGEVPDAAWRTLADREPICLVTDLDGERAGRTTWFTLETLASGHDDVVGGGWARHGSEVVQLFGRGTSASAVSALADGTSVLVDALWPTPRLLVVGDGLLADALQEMATFLGWSTAVTLDADPARSVLAGLSRGDAVVVLSHDRAVDGPVLEAALGGSVGYVGALGSRRTQAARDDWLTARGVPDHVRSRIRGPAGLDVGARTPQEIAVSVVGEILAVRSGAAGQALRDRPGPVHVDGLRTPPHRYDDDPLQRPSGRVDG